MIKGKLFLTDNYLLFYAKFYDQLITDTIQISQIDTISKQNSALVIPDGIKIVVKQKEYFFGSIQKRDPLYLYLVNLQKAAHKLEEVIASQTSELSDPSQVTPITSKERKKILENKMKHTTIKTSELIGVENLQSIQRKKTKNDEILYTEFGLSEDEICIECKKFFFFFAYLLIFFFFLDFFCAISKKGLRKGWMYLSNNFICFAGRKWGSKSKRVIPFKEITKIEKKYSLGIFPNAIEISFEGDKPPVMFTSFVNRDSTYDLLTNVWKYSPSEDDKVGVNIPTDDKFLHKVFVLPPRESVLHTYQCSLHERVTTFIKGILFVTQSYICFNGKHFNKETKFVIPFIDITSIEKRKTGRLFPNAIKIFTKTSRFRFASISNRDEALEQLTDIWKNPARYTQNKLPPVPRGFQRFCHSGFFFFAGGNFKEEIVINRDIIDGDEEEIEVATGKYINETDGSFFQVEFFDQRSMASISRLEVSIRRMRAEELLRNFVVKNLNLQIDFIYLPFFICFRNTILLFVSPIQDNTTNKAI